MEMNGLGDRPSEGGDESLRAILLAEPPPVEALIAVASFLADDQLDFAFNLVMGGVLAHRGAPGDRPLLGRLAGALLSHFPSARRVDSLREALSAMPELAGNLPASLLADTMAAARAIDWAPARQVALAKLAEHLRPEERALLIEGIAEALAGGEFAEGLPDLAPYLDEPPREDLLRQALETIRNLYWEQERVDRLRVLAPVLPESLLPEALAIAREIDWMARRGEAMIALVPRLTGPTLAGAVDAILGVARGLENEAETQIDLLVGLARVHAPEVPLPLVIRTAREIQGSAYRTMALVRIALVVPDELRPSLLEEASRLIADEALGESWIRSELESLPSLSSADGLALLDSLFPGPPPSRRPPLPADDQLRAMLTALSAEDRGELLQQYLSILLQWYGGAQAAPPDDWGEESAWEDEDDSGGGGPAEFTRPIPSDGDEAGESAGGEPESVAGEPSPEPLPPPAPVSSAGGRPRSPAPRDAPTPVAAREERIVNTGFADSADPLVPLGRFTPLRSSRPYYFWLEVGAPLARSIETVPTRLPVEHLPPEAKLTVALFSPPGSFSLDTEADTGELRIQPNGSVVVSRQVVVPDGISPEDPLLRRRLVFPVQTSDRPGIAYLRCNIYYNSVLVQSRLVRARVSRFGLRWPMALSSTVDYTLSRALAPAHLSGIPPHRLSVLLNRSADGTHSFWLHGEGGIKREAHFGGHELQDLIQFARRAMRRAAWGSDDYWDPARFGYRYEDDRLDLERLRADLVRFAVNGYRFHDRIINRLAGGYQQSVDLTERMRRPGLVQIANKVHASHLLPAALLYDHPGFDPDARALDQYTLCPDFVAAMAGPDPLEESPCFRGDCPSRDAEAVVCPSGFWGFRHALGMPLSVEEADEAPTDIVFDGSPRLAVAVSTDPNFSRRVGHEQKLRSLRAGLGWAYADTRDETIRLLGSAQAHLVYFYCHGGIQGNIPYLNVGSLSDGPITRATLRRRVRWNAPRPLVFINGCNTTAVEPEQALDLVSGLVENANAAGVVGTEITIFEPLACDFAEDCLRRFLSDGVGIGEAVRQARLALLKRGNPLGLVYIPFAMAGLRLVEGGSADHLARVDPLS